MNTSTDLRRFADLTRNLLRRELRSRYKRSTLGWTWSLINPLSSVVIYTLVFAVILDVARTGGRRQRAQVVPALPAVRADPLDLFAGVPVSGTESLVANGTSSRRCTSPGRRSSAVVGSVAVVTFADRARRALGDPADRRQHGAPLAADRGDAAGARGRAHPRDRARRQHRNVYLRDVQHLVTSPPGCSSTPRRSSTRPRSSPTHSASSA